MAKSKPRLWLARDPEGDGEYAMFIGPRKPKLTHDEAYWIESSKSRHLASFGVRAFHRLASIRLRRGQCVEIESIEFNAKAP